MPRRRPGKKRNYNLDCKDHLLFFIIGLDVNGPGYIDGFKNREHMELTWEENRKYLMNLFFYGDEKGNLGGYGPGRRPVGWWYCESNLKEIFNDSIKNRSNNSGVVGDSVFLDGDFYNKFKDYAIKDKYQKEKPHQFKLNQFKYLKDNDVLSKSELKKIEEDGLKDSWLTEMAKNYNLID